MTAQELRIGNLVLYEQTFHIVTTLNGEREIWSRWHKQSSEEDDYVDDQDRYSGIPLTPEILEKAGFVKTSNDYWLDSDYLFYAGQLYYFPDDCLSKSYADELVPNLHWFQNHYYFTFGEELKIEL